MMTLTQRIRRSLDAHVGRRLDALLAPREGRFVETIPTQNLTAGGAGLSLLRDSLVRVPTFPVRKLSASFDPSEIEANPKLAHVKAIAPWHDYFSLRLHAAEKAAYHRNALLGVWDFHVALTYEEGDARGIVHLALDDIRRAHAILAMTEGSFGVSNVDFSVGVTGGTGLAALSAIMQFEETRKSPYALHPPKVRSPRVDRHFFLTAISGFDPQKIQAEEYINAVLAIGLVEKVKPRFFSVIWFDNEVLDAKGRRTTRRYAAINERIATMKNVHARAWNSSIAQENVSDGNRIPATHTKAAGGSVARHGTLGYARIPFAIGVDSTRLARAMAHAIHANACDFPLGALAGLDDGPLETRAEVLFFVRAPPRVLSHLPDAIPLVREATGLRQATMLQWSEEILDADEVEIVAHVVAPFLLPRTLVDFYARNKTTVHGWLMTHVPGFIEEARAHRQEGRQGTEGYEDAIDLAIRGYGWNGRAGTQTPWDDDGQIAHGLRALEDSAAALAGYRSGGQA